MQRLRIPNEVLEDHVLPLDAETLVVGRDPSVDLRLGDASVSRWHARLERCADGGFRVVDLDSSNGTFVNEARIDAPTELEEGDRIRFGVVVSVLEAAPEPALRAEEADAREDAAAAPSASPFWTRRRLLGALVTLVSLAVAGVSGSFILEALGEDAASSRAEAEADPGGHAAAGVASEGDGRADSAPHDPPGTGPAAEGTEGGAEAAGAPVSAGEATTTAPETAPTPAEEAAPPTTTVQLLDGTELEGRVLDREDPIAFVLALPPDGRVRRVPREEITAIDGTPYTADLDQVFAARLDLATDVLALEELGDWCTGLGLLEARETVARRILEGRPDHARARGWLGQRRYRGAWLDAEELTSRGLLDAEGRLVGSLADVRRIRRLWFDLFDRPPSREEFAEALEAAPEALVGDLVGSEEAWAAWMTDLLVRFLGAAHGTTLAAASSPLVGDLAAGATDFRDAFEELALSEAVRVAYPEPEDFARRLLLVCLGPGALQDEALVASAAGMVRGERTAVLGERGSSSEELIGILVNQPGFYRNQIRQEARRALGREPEGRALTQAAIRLAVAPASFTRVMEGWYLDAERDGENFPPRPLSAAMRLATAYRFVLGRQATTAEASRALPLLARGGPSFETAFLLLLAEAPGARRTPPPEEDRDLVVRRHFRHLLGRDATTEEAEEARDLLGAGGPARLAAALLLTPEARVY